MSINKLTKSQTLGLLESKIDMLERLEYSGNAVVVSFVETLYLEIRMLQLHLDVLDGRRKIQ